jgi:hypothetical protein
MEPPDPFEKYLDPKFTDRAILPARADGRPCRGMIVIDGLPTSMAAELRQYRCVAMLPVHDVHLACQELLRCVTALGAVGSFRRPNLAHGHHWHSN